MSFILGNKDHSKNHFSHTIIQNIINLKNKYKIEFIWVKGHNGFDFNERADTLAKNCNNSPVHLFRSTGYRRSTPSELTLFDNTIDINRTTETNLEIIRRRVQSFKKTYNIV